jgi:Fis family transcriptional regulator
MEEASQKRAKTINIDSKKITAVPLSAHVKQTIEMYFSIKRP